MKNQVENCDLWATTKELLISKSKDVFSEQFHIALCICLQEN